MLVPVSQSSLPPVSQGSMQFTAPQQKVGEGSVYGSVLVCAGIVLSAVKSKLFVQT